MQDFKTLFHNLKAQCTTRSLMQEYQNLSIMILNGYCGHMVAYDSLIRFIDASKPSAIVEAATEDLIQLCKEDFNTTSLVTKHIIEISKLYHLTAREEQAMLDEFDKSMGLAPKNEPFTQEDIDSL